MTVFVVFLGVLGIVVGSFLNVVAIRVPAGRSLGGRSQCASCGVELGPLDLVPIASWVALRGRCRRCGAPVSASYAVVEAVCGVLFAGLAALIGPHLLLAPALVLAAGLLTVAVIGFRGARAPNRHVSGKSLKARPHLSKEGVRETGKEAHGASPQDR